MKYQGNNPKRRIAKHGFYTCGELEALASEARYEGSPHHKTRPADYGFHPPAAPRPSKSVCDGKRPVHHAEALRLLQAGFRLGVVSLRVGDEWPKYVWAVDDSGEVYEAKLGHDQRRYHGYRLGEDDSAMCKWVATEWSKRMMRKAGG